MEQPSNLRSNRTAIGLALLSLIVSVWGATSLRANADNHVPTKIVADPAMCQNVKGPCGYLAPNSVDNKNIADNSIMSSMMTKGAVKGPHIAEKAITPTDVAIGTFSNAWGPKQISSVGANEVSIPAIVRSNTEPVTRGGGVQNPMTFDAVSVRSGGADAPPDCPGADGITLDPGQCIPAPREGLYYVSAKIRWEGNATGERYLSGYSLNPSTFVPSRFHTDIAPGRAADADSGAQVQILTFTIELDEGDWLFINPRTNGPDVNVLAGSTVSMIWVGEHKGL